MGNFNTTINSASIQETQLIQSQQQCVQTADVRLEDTTVTVINSTVGNITFTNSYQVGNLDCILNATVQQAVDNKIANITQNTATSLFPFTATINDNTTINSTDISSFQQSLIDQACNQSTYVYSAHNSITIIDSVTGNILIANSAIIDSQSCNLAASTYQMAVNQVTNDTKNTVQQCDPLCCATMILPMIAAIVVLPILAKTVGKMGGGGGGGAAANPLAEEESEANILSTIAGVKNASSGGGSAPVSGPVPSSMGGMTSIFRRSNPTAGQAPSTSMSTTSISHAGGNTTVSTSPGGLTRISSTAVSHK